MYKEYISWMIKWRKVYATVISSVFFVIDSSSSFLATSSKFSTKSGTSSSSAAASFVFAASSVASWPQDRKSLVPNCDRIPGKKSWAWKNIKLDNWSHCRSDGFFESSLFASRAWQEVEKNSQKVCYIFAPEYRGKLVLMLMWIVDKQISENLRHGCYCVSNFEEGELISQAKEVAGPCT